jgi:signal transduction histidine kinase
MCATIPVMGTEHAAWQAPATRAGFLGTGLRRSADNRVIAGVAAGVAGYLRVDRMLIRLGFALLAVCGGVGLLAYLALWLTVPAAPYATTPPRAVDHDGRRDAAVALVLAGLIVILRSWGLWFGTTIAASVGLVSLGLSIVWLRSDQQERARLSRIVERAPEQVMDAVTPGGVGPGGVGPAGVGPAGVGRMRLAAGGLLLAVGLAVFLVGTDVVRSPAIVLPVVATAAGVGVIFGPFAWRLLGQLGQERAERIRSQERAEMAAHLHDSVLQTLALIQRAEGPRDMVALARNQERELRTWLIGRSPAADDTVAGAIEKAAAAVELNLKVPVEVVTVGDAPLDDRLRAIVDATREATLNAAKHSGAPQISIYVEVEPTAVTAYVRDQGAGFDPDGVASDRRGISESIRGRMQRAGGSATILSEPEGGTEVQLTMPRAS